MRALVALLIAVSAAPVPSVAVRHQVAHLARTHATPLYWVGLRYRGMTLVYVESGPPVDLEYADCSADQASIGGLACRHVLEIEAWPPAPGEISTQGRCTYRGVVRGATVALFPVNPRTLRVFMLRTTLYVSGASLADDLAAVRTLRGLNTTLAEGAPLPVRNVTRALGRCKAPLRRAVHLTPKQRYELRMKHSFSIETASTLNFRNLVPRADVREFLASWHTFALLLRDEATRVSMIRPPSSVADLHAALIRSLRTYATDVERALRLVRAGASKNEARWRIIADRLDARFARDTSGILAIAREFRRRGYVVYAKPTD